MHNHQQEATCGLQVCQHPLCWATNRQAARGLLHLQGSNSVNTLSQTNLVETASDISKGEEYFGDEEEEDIFEGLPTVTILNMIDDYGADGNDRYPSPTFSAFVDQPGGDYKPRKSVNILEPSKIVPKLALKSVTTSQSAEDVTAPANTPLQSSHGFGDYHHEYRSPLGHMKYDSHKPVFTETTTGSVHGRGLGTRVCGYGKVQLEISDAKAAGSSPKKLLIWRPPKTRRSRAKQLAQIERPSKMPSLKAVSLPLNTVPEFRPTPTSHKAIKATIPKKTQTAFATARKMRAVREAATARQPRGPSGATPQEIAQLRKVPADVLIRVLHQAEENGIISKTQTNLLLTQVVGRRDKLPSIKETPKSTADKSVQYKSEEIEPKTPLETKNLKILNAEEVRTNSPRTVLVDPVYRMDTEPSLHKHPSPRQSVPPATQTAILAPVEKAIVPSIDIPPPDDSLVQTGRSEKVLDNEDSQYDEKLRDFAEENLRSIGALPRDAHSPKKTPVKYVATLFDQTVPPSPPIKPFHYPKSPRDIFLGPIPSPPPPTPPTERDSLYDPQVGGSTVMVIPSMTGPSTITSFGEKRSSSPSDSKTPTTGREADGRLVKTTQTSINGSQRCRNLVSSPFGSNSGPDGWPQVNEEDFMRTAGSSELGGSPLPSFTEEDMRLISRNQSTSSPREETSLPGTEKFQNLRQGEIHSPAPPPPSPEPLTPAERQSAKGSSSRVGGAATALGLVTLEKNSSQTSPETGAGVTPTPVVSSVRSDIETPLGRVTRSQTVGSTPAIPETPYERDSEGSESAESKKLAEDRSISIDKSNAVPEAETDFEVDVSPDIAKEELEKEIEKLEIG